MAVKDHRALHGVVNRQMKRDGVLRPLPTFYGCGSAVSKEVLRTLGTPGMPNIHDIIIYPLFLVVAQTLVISKPDSYVIDKLMFVI